jgi:hypothetical protein
MFPGTPQERTLPTRWCASLQEMTKNFLNGACTLQCEAVPLLKAAMSPGPGVDRLPVAKFDVRRAFEDVERIAGREVTVEVTRARASLGAPDPRGDAATGNVLLAQPVDHAELRPFFDEGDELGCDDIRDGEQPRRFDRSLHMTSGAF